jgi:bifunctional enzyme CysN/CysC
MRLPCLTGAKGLYAKAGQGKIANFTGLSGPYERPDSSEVQLNTLKISPDQCVQGILSEVIKQQ